MVGYSPGARNRVRHDWTHLNNYKWEPEQRATLDFDLHSSWKAHTNTHVTMSPCRTIIQHNHGLKLLTFQALKSCWTILMQTTLFSRYVGAVCVCVCVSHSIVSNFFWPHGLEPARLLCPWGFSRKEYWSGLPFPSPGELPNPGIKPRSFTLQADSLSSEPPGKPYAGVTHIN